MSLGYKTDDLRKYDEQSIRQMARSTDKEVIAMYQKHFELKRNERIEKAKEEYLKQKELFGSTKENQLRQNMDKEDMQKLMKMEQQLRSVFLKKRKIEEDKQKRLKEIQDKAKLKVKMKEHI